MATTATNSSPFDSGNNRGWVGTWAQLEYVLKVHGCDRHEDGRYVVSGGIFAFQGDAEYAVGEDALYYVDRQPKSLVHALRTVGQGMDVTVIS